MIKSKATIFKKAVESAAKIYHELYVGKRSGGYHRVHVSSKGKVSVTHAPNLGARDPDEYYGKVPHDLTLWEIKGEGFDLAEALDTDHERLGEVYRKKHKLSLKQLPKDPDEWTPKQWVKVNEAFVKKLKPKLPAREESAEKRKIFDDWAKENLTIK
jgi:hypothetical protein